MSSESQRKYTTFDSIASTIGEVNKRLRTLTEEGINSKENPTRAFLLAQQESHDKTRFLDRISILLLGSSDAGKMSIINNLFNLDKDAENAANTSSTSETRSVNEYELQLELPENGIKNMKIAIVDSPGFHDTDGVKQDACNFYAIKKFYETHPSAAGRRVYPNLIFVTIPASYSLIGGDNNFLSKSLRALAQLDVVHPEVPNVIGVITKAGQFSRDKKKWLKEFNEFKNAFKEILFKQFQVAAKIVAVENSPEAEGFSKKGDNYYLPDKVTLQPQNLFKACSDILKESGDLLGNIVFRDGFKNKKFAPQIGFRVVANTANNRFLSKEEKMVTEIMTLDAEVKNIDETLSDHAMTFIIDKSLQGTQEEDNIQKLCQELKKKNFTKPEHVSGMTKSNGAFLGEKLSSKSLEFLEMLGVRDADPASVDNTKLLIGQGYNILTDKPVPSSILKPSSRTTEFGIKIPKPAKIVKVNQSKFIMEKFLNKDEFARNRQIDLGISLDIDAKLLKTGGRAGYNIKDETSQTSSSEEHSSLLEIRLFQLSIPELKGIPLSEEFLDSVKDLPKKFTLDDDNHKSSYEKFFNKYGHFMILEAFAGGSIAVNLSEETSSKNSFEECKQELTAHLNRGIKGFFDAGVSAEVGNASTTERKIRNLLNGCFIKGGDTDLHRDETIMNQELLSKWKRSLHSNLDNLDMLDTVMHLTPISDVVEKNDKERGSECYKALEHFLGGKFKADKVESEEKQRFEMVKRLEDVNVEEKRSKSNFFGRHCCCK